MLEFLQASWGVLLASVFSVVDKNRPVTDIWRQLNTTVGGRLAASNPWPQPCFSSVNGRSTHNDSSQCGTVCQNYFNQHVARSDVFAGYSATNFDMCMSNGDQCHLDFMNPSNPLAFSPPADCRQGSIPNYYIDVQEKDDVIAAFDFARKNGVPLVIKNTGHDFKGRSSGPGSLALWMHRMKYVGRYFLSSDRRPSMPTQIHHSPEFVADGCPSSDVHNAVTFGAGQQFEEIFQYLDKLGLQMVGGSDQSVGAAGGWAQGGGHSSLTPTYGLGADRTLQYKVVTPDGVARIANACQNEDLFWALRGGGGGTFGVVLEATMMVSQVESYRVANINWPPTAPNLKQVLEIFLNNATNFALQGWGGYVTITTGNIILMTPRLNLKEAQESMHPLVELTTQLGGVSTVTEVPTFLSWFDNYVRGMAGAQALVGLPIAMASRLVPQKNHATPEGRTELLEALSSAFGLSVFSQIHFTSPYGFTGSNGSDTSVNPVWRTSLYQVIVVNSWLFDSTLEQRKEAYAQTTKSINYLRDITPDSGAYHNEADIHEPNYGHSFYNTNYVRLLEIKNK
ncbi:hypothetical protein NLJ89_g7778 [Agrocybe chaxingu]|uniref:FAD-binding PCMH-type domain-containing protein n=1 Tax=Agrocybe chaxingu TaxID=84603 RepID=A0A9W8MSS4_9AGAR|nr:hypothetical protein NLJ89_g7778 [Agrocybe chaxingu]